MSGLRHWYTEVLQCLTSDTGILRFFSTVSGLQHWYTAVFSVFGPPPSPNTATEVIKYLDSNTGTEGFKGLAPNTGTEVIKYLDSNTGN